jgi:hypothetical protein
MVGGAEVVRMIIPYACCGIGFCPVCAGRRPTYRSVLAHRQAFQDVRGIQQSGPVAPVLAGSPPPEGDRSDEISGCLRVNVVSHHAPDTAGSVMANAEILVSQNRKP